MLILKLLTQNHEKLIAFHSFEHNGILMRGVIDTHRLCRLFLNFFLYLMHSQLMVVAMSRQRLNLTLFQDIQENVCFTVYPHKAEVPVSSFENGKGDPNHSLERHVGQQLVCKDDNGTKVTKMEGTWVYSPYANTQPPPLGHLLNHCRKFSSKYIHSYLIL